MRLFFKVYENFILHGDTYHDKHCGVEVLVTTYVILISLFRNEIFSKSDGVEESHKIFKT